MLPVGPLDGGAAGGDVGTEVAVDAPEADDEPAEVDAVDVAAVDEAVDGAVVVGEGEVVCAVGERVATGVDERVP